MQVECKLGQQIGVKHFGLCSIQSNNNISHELICGSNLKLYSNECQFLNDKQCFHSSLKQISSSHCTLHSFTHRCSHCNPHSQCLYNELNDSIECSCEYKCEHQSSNPICASNNQTFNSQCELK